MRSQVISVVAGRGGVGTTTTAIGLALALVANADGAVVLMDARAGTQPLSARLGAPAAPTVMDVAKDPWGASPATTPDGLRLVDGGDWRAVADATTVGDALGVLTAAHDVVVVDVGTDLSDRTVPVVAGSDLVVVVVAPDGDAVQVAERVAIRVADMAGSAQPALVVALVARTRDRTTRLRRSRSDGVVPVPYDRSLVGGGVVRRGLLNPATWHAYVSVAEYVDDASLGGRGRAG
jgi:septum site-determining protein MinD